MFTFQMKYFRCHNTYVNAYFYRIHCGWRMGPLLQDPDLIGWSRVEGSDFFYNVIVANCNCNIMKEIPLYGWQVGPTPHNGTDWFYYRDREPAYLDREVLLAVLRPFFLFVKFSCILHFSRDCLSQRIYVGYG